MADIDPNVKLMKTGSQYFAATIINMGALCLGIIIGWASPAGGLLQSEKNISSEELNWVIAIMMISAAISSIAVSLILDRFGRKTLIMSFSLGAALSWALMIYGEPVEVLYTGRFFGGFFVGAFCVVSPIMVAEIAHPKIRGALGVMFQLMINIGILLMFCLGETNNLYVLSIVPTAVVFVMFVMLFCVRETPVYLVKVGKIDAAKKSLQGYRGADYNIDQEMSAIQAYAQAPDETFCQSFKKRAGIMSTIILCMMFIIQQFTGITAVMFYASTIFEKAGSSLSPGVSAIILALVQVIITFVAAILVDRTGRRILWLVSLGTMAICHGLFGGYMLVDQLNPELAGKARYLPIIAMSVFIIGYSLGTGPLPWTTFGEIVPNRIRNVVNPVVACLNSLLAFVVVYSFQPLCDSLGIYVLFFFFGVVAILGMLFILIFVPETKNKTLEDIQVILNKTRTEQQAA